MSSAGGSPFSLLWVANTWNKIQTFASGFYPIAKNITKAWVVFNGVGALAVLDSFQVSSVTDNGVGDYTVNFTTAFANANYWVGGSCVYSNNGTIVQTSDINAPTAAACRILVKNVTIGNIDNARICVAFMGT